MTMIVKMTMIVDDGKMVMMIVDGDESDDDN